MLLEPQRLLYAYSQGIFPMADEDGTILWFDPDPRAIIPLEQFHVPRRLQRTVKQGVFDMHINRDFLQVIKACARPAPDRQSTWISDEIIDVYHTLHRLGYAHSVEAWQNGELAGGLYGVAINSFFAGESMFSFGRDASKVALVHLVQRLKERGFLLLDIQFLTSHLEQFGAIEISRHDYKLRLFEALSRSNHFD
jgi:leucyl/phenylalanyl-tRNA--protein transferase